MMKLKETYIELLSNYSNDAVLINDFWMEIASAYSSSGRFYHNITHLDHILEQMLLCKNEIQDWDAVLFALYYHDIIYLATTTDNEPKVQLLQHKDLLQLVLLPKFFYIAKK